MTKIKKYGSDVYALQRSEILDACTCNFCLSIDGRVFSVDDPFTKNDLFCPHCRGLWVEIMKEETEPPKITGIPDSLRDSFNGTESFVDLEKPIVEKDSLAYEFLNKTGSYRLDKPKKITGNGLDEHFKISEEIIICYRQRDKIPGMLERAIETCRKQIDLSSKAAQLFKDEYPNQPLPCHVGYDQLVIIYSKQSKYKEAIDLCKQAKEQGWCGDWDRRIKRYEKKLNRF